MERPRFHPITENNNNKRFSARAKNEKKKKTLWSEKKHQAKGFVSKVLNWEVEAEPGVLT